MSKIAVVYWSGTGNTEAMAKLVEEGILAAGGQADLLPPAIFTPDLVSGYDAIAYFYSNHLKQFRNFRPQD